MEVRVANDPSELESTRCATHPERAAIALCDRCGDYHCDGCHKRVAGRAFCARCRATPGVDYLEDTRLRFWGKRDGYIWYLGLFIPVVTLLTMPTIVSTGDAGHIVSGVVWLSVSIAYLAQYRPARRGIIALTVLDLFVDEGRAALGMSIIPTERSMSQASALATAFGGAFIGLVISIAAFRSPRNKLAFRIPVDDRDLQRIYDRYLSNPLAVRAAVYSAVFLLVPLASVFTLALSIRAFKKADPGAWPPRRGRFPAQLGIVISSLGVLAWATIVLRLIFKSG